MSGSGQRTNHQSRLDWWREQLQRQQKGTLSVALFCRKLGGSVASFYYGKRRVNEAASRIESPRVTVGHRSSHPIASTGGAVAKFVPVSVVDPGAGTELEIERTNACAVRLRGVIDPPLLQAAITAAGQLGGSRQGVH
jgi:hypothetical protein